MKTTRLILLGVSFVLGAGAQAFADPADANILNRSTPEERLEYAETMEMVRVHNRERGHFRHQRGFQSHRHHRPGYFRHEDRFTRRHHRPHYRPYRGGIYLYQYYGPFSRPPAHFYNWQGSGLYSYHPYPYRDRHLDYGRHAHGPYCPRDHFD